MTTEAQNNAVKKYKQKLKRTYLEFYPAEEELWNYLQSQPKKQTYIKELIRKDMEKGK